MDKSGKFFNPVYIMADSGARGSKADPSAGGHARSDGQAVGRNHRGADHAELPGPPCSSIISTHGARKGLADTARSRPPTRATHAASDVAQDVIISESDCGTLDGIEARAIVESGEIIEPLRDRIIGRVTLEKIVDPFSGETIVDVNEEIDEDKASAVQEAGIEKVRIWSC